MDIDISRSKKLRTSTGNGTGTVHSGTCSSDGCTLPFCITVRSGSIGKNKDRSSRRRSLEKDKDLDYQYCLKHYVAEIDSDERLLNGDVIVEDEYGLASQMKGVNSLWKEAVADVVRINLWTCCSLYEWPAILSQKGMEYMVAFRNLYCVASLTDSNLICSPLTYAPSPHQPPIIRYFRCTIYKRSKRRR